MKSEDVTNDLRALNTSAVNNPDLYKITVSDRRKAVRILHKTSRSVISLPAHVQLGSPHKQNLQLTVLYAVFEMRIKNENKAKITDWTAAHDIPMVLHFIILSVRFDIFLTG